MRSARGGGTTRAADGSPLQLSLWSGREQGPAWHVRISRRARRLSMRVFPGGRVEVIVPPGVGIAAVEQFVSRHRAWAERRSRELLQQAPLAADRQPESVRLGLLDRRWSVEYHAARRTRVEEAGEGLLRVHTALRTDRHVGQALVRWLTGVAVETLQLRLEVLAREIGIDYGRMCVRRQRTRWGSCSAAGTISLNVCLMFQRPAVVRYLMLHELCHRRHMNHSRRFWSLVQSLEPGWRDLDAELLQGWQHVPAWVFP